MRKISVLAVFLPALLLLSAGSTREKETPKTVRVEGTITYTGPIPAPIDVIDAAAKRYPVEVAPKNKGLKDAVVHLEGVPVAPKREKKKVQMDQKGYFFIPHVLAIEDGQEVEFLNNDICNHAVYAVSTESKNSFNIVIPASKDYHHTFTAVKHGISITCPLHAGMGAWICVFDHPYFTVSAGDGSYTLPAVPPGKYNLVVRHLDGSMIRKQPIVVEGENVTADVEFGKADLK